VALGYQGSPAFAGIENDNVSAVTSKINCRCKTRRSSADNETFFSSIVGSGAIKLSRLADHKPDDSAGALQAELVLGPALTI
jgi:hypothetical protein